MQGVSEVAEVEEGQQFIAGVSIVHAEMALAVGGEVGMREVGLVE